MIRHGSMTAVLDSRGRTPVTRVLLSGYYCECRANYLINKFADLAVCPENAFAISQSCRSSCNVVSFGRLSRGVQRVNLKRLAVTGYGA